MHLGFWIRMRQIEIEISTDVLAQSMSSILDGSPAIHEIESATKYANQQQHLSQ